MLEEHSCELDRIEVKYGRDYAKDKVQSAKWRVFLGGGDTSWGVSFEGGGHLRSNPPPPTNVHPPHVQYISVKCT